MSYQQTIRQKLDAIAEVRRLTEEKLQLYHELQDSLMHQERGNLMELIGQRKVLVGHYLGKPDTLKVTGVLRVFEQHGVLHLHRNKYVIASSEDFLTGALTGENLGQTVGDIPLFIQDVFDYAWMVRRFGSPSHWPVRQHAFVISLEEIFRSDSDSLANFAHWKGVEDVDAS